MCQHQADHQVRLSGGMPQLDVSSHRTLIGFWTQAMPCYPPYLFYKTCLRSAVLSFRASHFLIHILSSEQCPFFAFGTLCVWHHVRTCLPCLPHSRSSDGLLSRHGLELLQLPNKCSVTDSRLCSPNSPKQHIGWPIKQWLKVNDPSKPGFLGTFLAGPKT